MPFLVSWAGSDASLGSGVGSYTVYVSDNGSAYTPWLQHTTLTAAPFAGQDGHSYRFYTVATSNDGFVQAPPAAAQAGTVFDASPPVTAPLAYPSAGAGYAPAHWTGMLSGTTADNVSGVQSEQVSILDVTTGKYWTGTGFTSSTEIFVTASLANPGAVSTTWSVPFAGSNFASDGTYRIHAVATDAAGNAETAGRLTSFFYDGTPPITNDGLSGTTGTNGWYRSAVAVTLSASDATSGVTATYYTIDNGATQTYAGSPISVALPGTHVITYWSVDAAGNTEAAHTDSFKIDSTSPATTANPTGTSGSNGWYTSATVMVALIRQRCDERRRQHLLPD